MSLTGVMVLVCLWGMFCGFVLNPLIGPIFAILASILGSWLIATNLLVK